MMLRIKFNKGCYHLGERSGGTVDVCLRDGTKRSERWLGFIDAELAKSLEGAKPVKIVAQYYCDDAIGFKWIELKDDESIQGCAIDAGVYGVYNTKIRAVKSEPRAKKPIPQNTRWPSEFEIKKRRVYGGKVKAS